MIEGSDLPATEAAVAPQGEGTQLQPGQQLGKYEIIERLASGGMAEILLARVSGMLGFQKLVVIKRILPHLASRNDFIQMFLDEARIATTLNHPNVVQTYEVGIHSKSYFIAMEYLAGEDLRAISRRLQQQKARLPLEHALTIINGVAAGLHYAHEKRETDGKPLSIVHRDVTPQNVIVLYEGGVKLLDFGIAKAANSINETRSGSFKGKVPYMSPEQCRGEPLDRRTDVFSLGILLYELTLGRRLFAGSTDFQILKQIHEGAILAPRAVDPTYDPALESIVLRALENDPAERYQTARELQEALEQLAHERRLRLSPISLADYVQALFADKAGVWKRASVEGDLRQLEAHVATLAAERDAELARDPWEHEQLPQSAALPGLPDDAELARARRRVRWPFAVALVAALAGGGWTFRDRLVPSRAAVVRPVGRGPRAADPIAVPPPAAPAPPAGPAIVQVSTSPAGATLTLDGVTLRDRTPARLEGLDPTRAHLLSVKLSGYVGAAQRFTLEAGEEASLEFDLHRSGRGSVRRAHVSHAAPSDAPAPSSAAAPAPPVTPAVRDGEGTLIVASSPWCNVTIDGKPRGTTPLNVKLRSGPHDVVLANPEYSIQRTISVDIQPNQTVRKRLDFAPDDK